LIRAGFYVLCESGGNVKYSSKIIAVLTLLLMFSLTAFSADTISSFRDFFVDPPTLECLGFRWYIYGDDDGDGLGKLEYRRKGDSSWRDALPMMRVNREVANWDFEPYAAENLFAGSIMSLDADTEYEVRVSLFDPDGGEADSTLVVRTRAVPVAPKENRQLHLFSGNVQACGYVYTSIDSLCMDLIPGDLVLIHRGVHKIPADGVKITTSGTAEMPIVFREAGDGRAVFEADYNSTIFDIRDCNHLFFEDFTIRGGDKNFDEGRERISVANDTFHLSHAFFADGASNLTVTGCTIENIRMGFYSYSEKSKNWYIADNVITGRNENWYPRGHDNASHTGVNIYGRGHVVCHNRISDFWDCIAIANYGKPPHDLALQCVAIDFYNNECSNAVDDGIEADYGCHNIRVFNNRILNAHTGLSAQPTYGGPIYFIGNVLYNITSLNLKLHNWCTGLEIYHNTMVSARSAFRSYPGWQNAKIYNNLFLGVTGYALETGSQHPKTILDYNGYRRAESERLFKWDGGSDYVRYPTLEGFREATGFEKNGLLIDYDAFKNGEPPVEGATYSVESFDFALVAASKAVDAARVLANVNDDFAGNAPDLGALEYGAVPEHYGPRK